MNTGPANRAGHKKNGGTASAPSAPPEVFALSSLSNAAREGEEDQFASAVNDEILN